MLQTINAFVWVGAAVFAYLALVVVLGRRLKARARLYPVARYSPDRANVAARYRDLDDLA